MAPADQAGAGQANVEVAEHAAHRQRACPPVQVVHFLGGVAAADDGADGGANDHIGYDAMCFQGADDADMRKTAGGTTT